MKTEGNRIVILLLAVLSVGAILRFWDFGAVSKDCLTVEPDSRDKVELAEKTAFDEKSPEYYKHPRLLINTSAVFLKIGALFGYRGKVQSARIMIAYMMVLSLATTVLLYFIGTTVFQNRLVALGGAWLFAVAPVSVVGTHYIKEDVPVMFCCALALLAILKLARHGKPAYFLWTGITVGIALGTKLVAAMLAAPAIAACAILALQARREKRRPPWASLVVGLVLAPVGFFVFNHQDLLHLDQFWSRTAIQMNYARTGHWDDTVFSPWNYWWTFQLRFGLFPGMTAATSLAGIAGALLCIKEWRENPTALPLVAWVLGFYLLIESSSAKPFPFFVRYLYPMLPGLACLAAYAFYRSALFASSIKWLKIPASVAIVMALAWPAAKSIAIVSGTSPDTRVQAARWIDENLPVGSKIAMDGRFYSPRLKKDFESDRKKFCQGDWSDDKYDGYYLVANSFNYVRYFANEKYWDESRKRADCFRNLMSRRKVAAEFKPALEMQTIGFHNPIITVLGTNRSSPISQSK